MPRLVSRDRGGGGGGSLPLPRLVLHPHLRLPRLPPHLHLGLGGPSRLASARVPCRARDALMQCRARDALFMPCRAYTGPCSFEPVPAHPLPRVALPLPRDALPLALAGHGPRRAPNAPVQQKPEGGEMRGVMQVRMRRVRGVGGTERGWGGVGCVYVCVCGGGGCRSCCRLATRSC